MCGIVAYKGHRKSTDVILKGLQRLEYRGYDSAGISVLEDGLKVYKKKGKVDDLKESINSLSLNSTIGIGHTRWATHGEPNDVNAHPHLSASGKLSIIHNGIIENYSSLRQELTNKGYTFKSETDTEVLINFIEDIYINNSFSLEEALRISLSKIVGAYAIVILSEDHPDSLFAVRKGSPMVIGIGNEEFFFASDATPIIEYTNEVVYLNDLEVATVKGNDLSIRTIDDLPTTPYIQTIEMELESIEKGGYDHFMLKEIYEQPRSVSDCMRGRLNLANKDVVLGGIREYADQLIHAERIVIVACGTSWHAGLVAEYIFEDLCRIPVEVEYASEFRYRNPIINKGDVLIAISQSGETADTLAAMELAKEKGAIIFGVCNVVGSSIARMSHEGVYTHAGPEIGVASTKAFTAQLTVLTMIALKVAKKRKTLSEDKYLQFLTELETMPSKIEIALQLDKKVEDISKKFKDSTNFIYLGR